MPPNPPPDTSLEFANTIIQARFPASVTIPLAQIIMLDAAHGDSNIIDMCTKELQADGSYPGDSWRRFLIDVGPPDNEIRRNVIRTIVAYRQPRSPQDHDIPVLDGVPKLAMVQFTHTDRDHCGGGKALFQALATEATLQKYWEDTVVGLHHPKKRNPRWYLSLSETDPPSLTHPYTVKCFSKRWAPLGEATNLEQFNVFLRYTFTINRLPQDLSSSNAFQIPAASIGAPRKVLTVHCQISLFRRSPVGRTTQIVEFNLRAAHKAVFAVAASYPITTARRTGKRTVSPDPLPPPAPAPAPARANSSDERYDRVTGQLVPSGERKRADQMYYRIMEGFDLALKQNVVRRPGGKKALKRTLLNPMLWTPEQHNLRDFRLNLASMDIVGPTPIIYDQLIGDMMRVEYDQGTVKPGGTGKPPDAETKDSELHNMASIVTLLRRWSAPRPPPGMGPTPDPILSMLFTGDAHDRECQIRDTVAAFAGQIPPRHVTLLKIPHHGSGLSTSVEFYRRIVADVYLVCARQNNNGLPTLRILEAIVAHTTARATPAHIFFSNPDSLWNLAQSAKSRNGIQSNVNLLLSGARRPGAPGIPGKHNYRAYILKHPVPAGTVWTMDSTSTEKNSGIILLGRDAAGGLVVSADEQWWDIWDEARIMNVGMPNNVLSNYQHLRA